jgi:hypothetical protein
MEWQPGSSGQPGWFREVPDRSREDATGPDPAGGARARRWVLHGAHGGAVVASSQGPHVAPKRPTDC